jgi:ribosomal protein S6
MNTMLFALALPSWQEIFEFRVSQLVRPAWMFWLFGIAVAWGLLVMWREGRSGVKLLILGLGLQGVTVAEEPLNRHEFIQVAVTKAVNDLSKTEQVKKLRAKMFLANQGGDTATAEQVSRELTAMKQTAEAKATLAAAEDWDKIKLAKQVAKGPEAQVVAVDSSGMTRERLKQEQREREAIENQEAYRTWLLEQAVLMEAEKLRRQVQR